MVTHCLIAAGIRSFIQTARIQRTVCISPYSIKIGALFRSLCHCDKVRSCRSRRKLCADLRTVFDRSLCIYLIVAAVVVHAVFISTNILVVRSTAFQLCVRHKYRSIIIGHQILKDCTRICAAIAGEVRLSRAFAVVVDCGTIDQCSQPRVIVIGEAAVKVLECQTVLYNMCRTDTRAAQLEAVAVTIAVALAEFRKAVAECNTILNGDNTDRTGSTFCKQIPAVVTVVVCHTAVKDVALAAGQLCCKTVGIFHAGIVAVVLGSAVQDQIVAGPVGNGCCTGIITGQLQTSVLIVVEYHAFDLIVVAGEEHAVIGCLGDLKIIEVPVVTVQHNATLAAVCIALSGEVEHHICTIIRLDRLHCISSTAVLSVNEDHFRELVCTAQQVNGMACGQLGDRIGNRSRILFGRTAAGTGRRTEDVPCHRHVRCGRRGALGGGSGQSRCGRILGHADGGGHCSSLGFLSGDNRICSAVGKAAADRHDRGLVIDQSVFQCLIDRIAGIVHGVVKLPLEITTLYASGLGSNDSRHISRCICLVAVHDVGIGIEVVVACAAGNRLDAVRYFFRRAGNFIGIERGAVLRIRDIAGSTLDIVAASLDDTAGFAGECTLTQCIRTLSGTHHRVLTVAEVVVFRESRSSLGDADAVLGIAVEVVVIAVYGAGADSGVTGVGVIVPVVVIGHIVGFLFCLHALQVALSVVPEVVVGMCYIGGSLGVQCTVALGLIGI